MSFSVTNYLANKYNLPARPGAKCNCPFCGHRTFSVKRDDSLGKCFHPKCGRALSARASTPKHRIENALDRVFNDFHGELLRLANVKDYNAYTYCVAERGIHPTVVADSMLGCVPESYDVASVFGPYISELKEAAYREAQESRGNRKKTQDTFTADINALEEAQEKLAKCVERNPGWLAFFYTNARHDIVAIRFRKPYSKDIRMFKPTKEMGLFNRELFVELQSDEARPLNQVLLVLEGEFNQLQLQSLMARIHEAKNLETRTGYVNACAVGGVNNADIATVQSVASVPLICYDNDEGAGFALVESARKVMSVKAFTTPTPFKDMDEYLRSFEGDMNCAYSAVQQLVSQCQQFSREYLAVREELDQIRRSEGLKIKPFEANRKVADAVVADLRSRARLYHDGRTAYLFLDEEKHLIAIERKDWQLESLLARYGIAAVERLADQVVGALRLEAFGYGIQTEVFPFSHYRKDSNTLYVSNLGQQIYKVTTERIELVDNGTDGVLFRPNPAWQTFELVSEQPDDSCLDELLFSGMRFQSDWLTADECKVAFLLFVYAMFFPELFPTRPILALIGECGSGKTFALAKLGTLLFGPKFRVTSLSDDGKDLDAAVTNNSFVVLDNADSEIRWLEDKLAVIATGGNIKRRELYTTNREVEFPVRAFVGITSRTPHFKREDVADRLLPFHLGRIDSFAPAAILLSDMNDNRNRAMSELLGHLQDVVRALGEQAGTMHRSNFRMADFADFALKVAHASGIGTDMAAILDRLVRQQAALAMEDEPVIELLQLWLDNDCNVGREITSTDLCRELGLISASRGIEFGYRNNTKAFGKKLATLKGTLLSVFGMSTRTGHARAKMLSFGKKGKSHITATA